ncbi:ABC transporter permease [Pseudolysinimonas sp.]|uniref:ABC transporter permease n=1 Tax=Pseudolysinimonas sp. TaxID=2680009 RepID=UPI003F7F9F87
MIRVLGLQLRRDRVTMAVWILATALVALGSVAAVVKEYGAHHEQVTVLRLALANPSVLAFRGAPAGASTGSILWFELFSWLAVVVGLMNTFFATRHGRADEESGRRELVAATPIARSAPLAATLVLGVVANLLLGALLAGAFASGGVDAGGALLAGTTFAVTGLAFLGVGLLVGELAPTGRSANGIGAAVVIASYVLRAAGDAIGRGHLDSLTLDPAWPSWISPIGWGEQTLALSENRVALLLPGLALAIVTVVAAFAVHARRDLGASVLPERPGRATASPALRGTFGLAWRLHRPALIGWAAGGAVLGVATGSLAHAVGDLTTSGSPEIVQTLQLIVPGGRDQLVSLFLGVIMLLVGLLAAAAGIQGALRFRQEEAEGRAELLLAEPVSRWRLLLDAWVIGALAAIVVMGAAGVLGWLSLVGSDADQAAHALEQALIELPAALVFAGIAAVAVAVLPRAAVAATWALFAIAIVIGLFGQLLKLPKRVIQASPFDHVPNVPFDDWGPSAILITVDIALAVAAVVLIRRRDLTA